MESEGQQEHVSQPREVLVTFVLYLNGLITIGALWNYLYSPTLPNTQPIRHLGHTHTTPS